MYRFPMRKVKPSMTNPFEQLIDSYINDTTFTRGEKWESTTYKKAYGSEYALSVSIVNQAKQFMSNHKGNYQISTYPKYAELNNYLRGLGFSDTSNVNRSYLSDAVTQFSKNVARGNESLNVLHTKDYVSSGKSSVGGGMETYSNYETSPDSYKYDFGSESNGYYSENEGSFKSRGSYPTFNFRDYDVYMSYYRTMGFYIPNGWEIDFDYTNGWWYPEKGSMNSVDNSRIRKEWLWRKIVLVYVGRETYQTIQKIPLIGGFINAADYATSQRRGWFMLPALAFRETVDPALLNKMENALRRNPYNEKEQFAVARHGFPGDVSENEQEGFNVNWFNENAMFPGTKPWKKYIGDPWSKYWSGVTRDTDKARRKAEEETGNKGPSSQRDNPYD